MPSHLLGVLRGESVKWHWSEDELETRWSLSVVELALLPSRTDSGRLGFAILLKFFQFQGFFPSHQKSIPHEIVVYIAQAIQRQRIWTFTNGTDALASDIARKFWVFWVCAARQGRICSGYAHG